MRCPAGRLVTHLCVFSVLYFAMFQSSTRLSLGAGSKFYILNVPMCIILILEITPQHVCIFFSSKIKKLINYEDCSSNCEPRDKISFFYYGHFYPYARRWDAY